MAEENTGEVAAAAGTMVADGDNTTTLQRWDETLSIYDFAQMTSVDWDKVYSGHFNQLQFTSWNGLNIGRLTLSIWILASHLALVLLLLSKGSLRRQPKNILIVNVSLTNVLVGVFLVPAKLHFITGDADRACQLSVSWTLLNDYYQVCVALLAVLGLVVERLVYVFAEKRGTRLNRLATWINCALYFLLPWLLAAILVLPIFYEALVERVPGTHCSFRVRDHYYLALEIVSFAPAALAVFVTAPLAGLLDCLRSDSDTCTVSPSTPRGESLVIAALLSVLTVFCETPYFVVRVLLMTVECENAYCSRFNQGVTAGMWLRLAKASAMPFLWLVYSDIRDAMLCRIDYKKVRRPGSTSSSGSIEDDEDNYHLVNTRM